MTVDCRRGAAFVLRATLSTLVGMLGLLAVGCGNNNIQVGTPLVTVSTTNNHFTTFQVNIDSVAITRDDGTVVTVLGAVEHADLTQSVNVTEQMTAPAVIDGTYKTGTVTIDFTGAVVYVDVNGQNVPATVVDSTGAAVTTATVGFNFDAAKPLIINTAQTVLLSLDFDLAASTMVNATTSPATVTLNPFVVASVVPSNTNPVRARGMYVDANPSAGTFAFNTTPFIDLLDTFGATNVTTTAATTFDINGITYTGTAGVTALKALPLNTFVSAIGTYSNLSGVTPVLAATEVYAGLSVSSGNYDQLIGYVTSRTGNTINIHSANLINRLGTESYTSDAIVTLGTGTIVNIDGQAATGLTQQSVSIGQRVNILGLSATDASGNVTMDATTGEVRMQTTHLWGTLNSAAAGSLDLNLLAIDDFQVPAFTFAGTGTSSATDAIAASYAVNTGSIDQSATPATTLVRADGIVTPFGSAPPDFNASAVALSSAAQAVLQIEWINGGTTTPFTTASASELVVDLANANLGLVHEIDIGPTAQDVKALSQSPTIVPDPTNSTNFAVGTGGLASTINVYNTFAGFISAIGGTTLSGSAVAIKLVAIGHYNAASNTFTATRIDLVE